MEELNPVEKKVCRACGKEKLLKRFTKLASGNRGGVCNLCKSLGITIPNKKPKKEKPKNIALHLGFVKVEDYETTYKFLEKIGYNLKEDLHEQFCKKYGLTPRSPRQEFNKHISPKELGLI